MAIDFAAINEAAYANIQMLLERWLPGGKQRGHDYCPLNPTRDDRSPGSFCIDVRSGAWIDFATDDKGGDLIALYAYLNGCSQGAAARAVAEEVGITIESEDESVRHQKPARRSTEPPPAAVSSAQPLPPASDPVVARPILPVPPEAPPLIAPGQCWTVPIWRPKAVSVQRYEPTHLWTYRDAEGALLGHVMRLDQDGKKATLPVCWCTRSTGTAAWCLRAFPAPRPLFGLDRLAARPEDLVVVCEGEKAAEAAERLLRGHPYVCVTSPSGSKAARLADWTPLAGRRVIIWPDHDAAGQRYAQDVLRCLREIGVSRCVVADLDRLHAALDTDALPFPKGFDAADLPETTDPDVIVGWLELMAAMPEDVRALSETEDASPTRGPEPTDGSPVAARRRALNIGGDYPTIALHNTFVRTIEAANDPPAVFRRGDHLCRIIHGADGRTTIKPFDSDAMGFEIAKRIDCYRLNERGQQRFASPPPDHMRRLLIHQDWNLPILQGVVTAPSLRPDGTLLANPGYDPSSRLFYQPMPGLEMPDLPDEPTTDERIAALDLLTETIGEFPYADDASRANALALILTCALRPSITGPVPMALLDATRQGTGKTLLAETATIIGCGSAAPLWPPAREEEEWRKRLMSGLIGGAPAIIFDNIVDTLESAALASVLTATDYEDRILGSTATSRVPVHTVFLATGNNIRTGADLARRCYRIKLDSQMERPWIGRSFSRVLPSWALDHRAELLAAALILGRAWFTAGCPAPATPSLGRFEAWSTIIGGVLQVAGIDGFLGNLEDIYAEGDEESSHWGTFLTAWTAYWGARPARVGDLVQFMEQNWSMREALPPDLLAHYDRPASFMSRLGCALRKRDGLVVGGHRLVGTRDRRTKNLVWTVQAVGSEADPVEEALS